MSVGQKIILGYVTDFVMRHKFLLVLGWLLLASLGAKTAGRMMHRMDYTYTTPGQPGYIANQHILERFGIDATFEPFLAVLHLPKGSGMDTSRGQTIAAKVFASATDAGIVAVADYENTHNPIFVFNHGQWDVGAHQPAKSGQRTRSRN